MADCCNNWTRSHLLREAAAKAGEGLPVVEPGMPLPAGTGLSRRSFMLRSAGLAMAVYGGSRMFAPQAFEEGIAHAATNGRVLVSVFMDGGMDSLSLMAPTSDSRYSTLRPTLGLPADAAMLVPHANASGLTYHPEADGLKALDDAQKVTVFPAIGYDDPDQSHFTSRHYWEVGATDPYLQTGWMGRLIDATGTDDNPLQGLSLSTTLSPSLATASKPVAAVTSVTGYTLNTNGVWDTGVRSGMHAALGALGTPPETTSAMQQARGAVSASSRLRAQLSDVTGIANYRETDSFSTRMEGLAAMIADPSLPLQCVSVSASGGYDTHSNQATDLASGIRRTTRTIEDFQADIEARGLADRVLVLLWSEFGRRPDENGSAGTDHGAAGSAFLIGSRARSTMIGEFPGLATLDPQDNLRNTSDFRQVYTALLEDWLGGDPAALIPNGASFSPYDILKP